MRLLVGICYCFLLSTFSLEASSLLVRYPISRANGVQQLGGEAQDHITVTPLKPSKQLGNSASRGVLGNTSGDYLTSSWPEGDKRHQGKFFEFKITAQSGFEIEYDKLEFTLYSLKDKKTQDSLGPRFWELRASVDQGGVWNSGSSGSIFSGDGNKDKSVQLAFIDMNDHSGSIAKIDIASVDALLGTIRTGKTTSFRLYGYDAGKGQGGLYNVWGRGTDLSVYGTLHSMDQCKIAAWGNSEQKPIISPIPEPCSTALFLASVALCFVFFRKRR